MLELILFSASVTGPIFLVLALGVLLRRRGLIDEAFTVSGSRLVFNIALPVLLFTQVATLDVAAGDHWAMIGFGMLATLLVFGLLELVCRIAVPVRGERGVIVQGGYRSNMAIIGLATCVNAFGEAGLQTGALYVGLVTILFNVLAVITLSRSLSRQPMSAGKMLKGIAGNPLIIGIVAGLVLALSGLGTGALLGRALEIVAALTLPLALLCTGAALDLRALRHAPGGALLAVGAKLILVPAVFAAGAALAGFRGVEFGVLLLMSAAPTAAASYVMVQAMGGNATLAANIIALTTAGAIVTTSLWAGLARGLGLI